MFSFVGLGEDVAESLYAITPDDFEFVEQAVDVAHRVDPPAHEPLARAGRVVERDPTWLLQPIDGYPHAGSAYVLWDTGSPRSPATNTPARPGHDPHDDTPNIPAVQKLKDEFWHPNGAITDGCAGQP